MHSKQHYADSSAQFVTRPTTAQRGAYLDLKSDGLTPPIADVARLCRWEWVPITHDLDASVGNGLCCRIFQSLVKSTEQNFLRRAATPVDCDHVIAVRKQGQTPRLVESMAG
ncbi:hypothetical protein WL94_13555 [Burkholderia cepacia]|nr:hypothetical protein WL94_13555 [Burkholderia cepacia]